MAATASCVMAMGRSAQSRPGSGLSRSGAPRCATGAMWSQRTFADKYGAKYDEAVGCLTKDRQALLAFFDFPAEHWEHLRTSNPIESVFATVRHRTVRTKGALSAKTAKLMVFKLVNDAAKTWRRLKGQISCRHRSPRCWRPAVRTPFATGLLSGQDGTA
jgi:hypothetical protein